MTFSRTEPETVYLITGYNALGAWRSADGGETWQRIYRGLHLTSLVLDTEFPDHILIGDNLGQIIRSTNHGLSWDIVAGAPLDLGEFEEGYAPTIQGMVADPLDTTRFYAASSEGRFLVSSDRGSNWEAIDADYPDATSLAIDRGGSNTLYVGTTLGVWRSINEGQAWEPTGTLPGITMSVATQPGSAGVVMAGTTEGLFYSNNSGDTWLQRNDGLTYDDITVLEWSEADPDTVLAGTYKGIFIQSRRRRLLAEPEQRCDQHRHGRARCVSHEPRPFCERNRRLVVQPQAWRAHPFPGTKTRHARHLHDDQWRRKLGVSEHQLSGSRRLRVGRGSRRTHHRIRRHHVLTRIVSLR